MHCYKNVPRMDCFHLHYHKKEKGEEYGSKNLDIYTKTLWVTSTCSSVDSRLAQQYDENSSFDSPYNGRYHYYSCVSNEVVIKIGFYFSLRLTVVHHALISSLEELRLLLQPSSSKQQESSSSLLLLFSSSVLALLGCSGT